MNARTSGLDLLRIKNRENHFNIITLIAWVNFADAYNYYNYIKG